MKMRLSGRVGMIARFKPVHNGHAPILRAMCDGANEVLIGLGSANLYDLRNPFTARESKEMIDAVLSNEYSNYSFVEVKDLFDGPKWRAQVKALFGKLDHFVTANDYVKSLLCEEYNIVHPLEIISERTPVTGTMVRGALAWGANWQALVPREVSEYISAHKLDDRFCREFGLETLAYSSKCIERTVG